MLLDSIIHLFIKLYMWISCCFCHHSQKSILLDYSKKRKKPTENQQAFVRYLADSNCCPRFCRPIPNHSGKVPFCDCKDTHFFNSASHRAKFFWKKQISPNFLPKAWSSSSRQVRWPTARNIRNNLLIPCVLASSCRRLTLIILMVLPVHGSVRNLRQTKTWS